MDDYSVKQTFELRAQNYNNDMKWLDDEKIIKPMIPATFGNNTALDICCGNGLLAKKLLETGWDVVAGDLSQDMLGKIDFEVRCQQMDVCDIPYADNAFDLVVCRQGLQYTNMDVAIKSIMRVTSNEVRLGHVTINCAEDEGFWHDYFSIAAPGRKSVVLPNEIPECVERCGLKIVDCSVVYTNSNMLSTLKYLDAETRHALARRIIDSSEEFKKKNGITVINEEEILRKRRWEFVVCKK